MSNSTGNNLEHLGFVCIEPSATLTAFIDCYWFIDATCTHSQGYQQFLHPDGGMGIIFNYGDSLFLNGQYDQSSAYLDGTNTKTTQLVLTENINAVGIRFKPAGASVFFNTPLDEFKNQHVGLADFNSCLLKSLYHQIPEQKNLKAKVATIEKVLIRERQQKRIISKGISNAIQQLIDSQGLLPLSCLSQNININQRKLERLFKKQMGMSASEYAKTIRAERARVLLKNSDYPLAEVAYKLGFFDQAHFTRSFKSVIGITPGQYRMNSQAFTHHH